MGSGGGVGSWGRGGGGGGTSLCAAAIYEQEEEVLSWTAGLEIKVEKELQRHNESEGYKSVYTNYTEQYKQQMWIDNATQVKHKHTWEERNFKFWKNTQFKNN